MPDDPTFSAVMEQLRRGDPAGADRVFRRFARRLIALAGSRLDPAARGKVDPEDVVQSAFRSFFARDAAGGFDLSGWDGLWAVLVVITVRKCGRQRDRYRAARRDARREAATGGPAGDGPGWEAVARDPSADEAVELGELVEGLFRELGPEDGRVLEMKLQGYSTAEIAAETGRSERTVQRVLTGVRARLHSLLEADD